MIELFLFAIILFLLVIIVELAWAIWLLRTLTWNTGKTADYLYEEHRQESANVSVVSLSCGARKAPLILQGGEKDLSQSLPRS